MKTHKWILPVVTQPRIGAGQSAASVTRTDRPARATRGILIMALVLGGLGAEGTVTSVHATGDQASAHYAPGNNHLVTSAYRPSPRHAIANPFMY